MKRPKKTTTRGGVNLRNVGLKTFEVRFRARRKTGARHPYVA